MASPEQSAEAIYRLLNEALSEDATRRKAAEKALRDAEEEQDFFASLAQIAIASDEDAAPVVRWLAAVCGKNATPRSWRRHTRQNAVTDDERYFVCDTLLDSLGEKHSNISTQISVWIAAIARIDFPRHWSSVISDLCTRIRDPDSQKSLHALVTLDMSLKQLASRRLMADRVALHRVGPDTFSLLYELFCSKLDELIAAATSQQQNSSGAFDVVVYCLKSLRRIICHGCNDISDLSQLSQLFIKIDSHPELFMCGATGGNNIQRRLSLLAAKLVRKTQERHPISFQPFLSGFLQLYYNTILAYDANISDERICVHAAAYLENVYQSPCYGINSANIAEFSRQQDREVELSHGASAEGCRNIILSFFSFESTKALIQTIIQKIFVLSNLELETWANDPETLVRDEEFAAEWGTESLRYECEKLFNLFVIRDKGRLAPYIVRLTMSVSAKEPLLLDACYRAVGRAARDIRGAFEFDSWLDGPVGKVLESPSSNDLGSRIIQARTVWLVGQFVEQLTRTARAKVYPLIVQLLSDTQLDRVIALTAAKTVQYLVDDLGFYGEDFTPYLPTCIESCFKLILSSSAFETKRDLLDTVGNLVSACEAKVIEPVARQIISSMPNLWDESGKAPSGLEPPPVVLSPEHDLKAPEGTNGHVNVTHLDTSSGDELLRTSIVTLLTAVIRKTGVITLQASETRKVIMAVLEYSIDIRPGRGGLYMLEEGCELWLAVIEASGEYSNDLHRLFPFTMEILRRDYENLNKVFDLMKAYMLLGADAFMREFAQGITQTLRRTMENVRDRGCLAAVDVADLIVRAFPNDGVRVCTDVLRYAVSKVSAQSESGVVMGAYMGLIARAALVNVGDVEAEIFRRDEATCVEILDLLIEHLDTMNRLPRRQVGTLALIGLCGRYMVSEGVAKRVPASLNCVVQVLSEEDRIRKKRQFQMGRNDFENMVARVGEKEEEYDGFARDRAANPVSNGEQRRKQLAARDVEVTLKVGDACTDLLMQLSRNEQLYTQILNATDQIILQQLEALLRQ